ncbi:DNA methyltransferase [Campylobacter hominis]|uniref:DNA methyltransferase n=1 Tax=Campylobacter hominis TaxID=76517 RepID=UPI00248CBCEE|nr:site-specific DNA-methyltransferase [Campylobacter hominis]
MKFLDELKNVLSIDERFIGEDNQVIKTKVSDAVRSNDEKLLKSLLKNELLKKAFFTKVDDVYVFDKNKFIWVLESKEFLPDSYTIYKNKIGLVDKNNNLISQKEDVSLVWAYKDCVLEGGQTKEDQKRDEIFYNETLAPDQVNRLLAPKVLANAKRYTKDGVEENIEFKEDDNLIIKGNNLLALSSLLEKFEGKVKLIYIDPPYNTGNDSFGYNDNFNHSTWLTFMKNRIEPARRLLRDDGVIFVQCDDNEQAYLKVLMDSIFGRLNYDSIIWRKIEENASTGGTMKITNTIRKDHEYILVYYINKSKFRSNKFYELPNFEGDYKNLDNDPRGEFKAGSISMKGTKASDNYYSIITPSGREVSRVWRVSKEEFEELDKDNRIYYGKNGDAIPQVKIFLQEERLVTPKSIFENMGSAYSAKDNLNTIFNSSDEDVFPTPKPEALLERIIKISTQPEDLILDFHLGSGTTAAVAHKMGRKYIGIEQMDNQIEIILERLLKVIDGEQGGISKSVNWQGGDSFVYCELLEDNENLVNELEKAENTEQVKIVLNKAIDNGKLIPSVLPSDLKKSEKDFEALSLDEQRSLVMELLNKNKLYVNLSDMDDEDCKVNEADKKFTRSFYGKE